MFGSDDMDDAYDRIDAEKYRNIENHLFYQLKKDIESRFKNMLLDDAKNYNIIMECAQKFKEYDKKINYLLEYMKGQSELIKELTKNENNNI